MANSKIKAHVIDIPVQGEESTSAGWGRSCILKFLPRSASMQEILEVASSVASVRQVRFFPNSKTAHVKFSSISECIRFMELASERDLDKVEGFESFHLSLGPSWDSGVMVFEHLPEGLCSKHLLDAIHMCHCIEIDRFLTEPPISNNKAVIQFRSQADAKTIMWFHEKFGLKVNGVSIAVRFESAPAIRLGNVDGFKNKQKVIEAFEVTDRSHIIGVVLFKKFGYVLFDYRSNMEKAFASRQFTGLRINCGGSIRHMRIQDVAKYK